MPKIFFLNYTKVPHGHPEDVTKHVGDLGILEFRQVPAEWPEDVIRCKANQIGILFYINVSFKLPSFCNKFRKMTLDVVRYCLNLIAFQAPMASLITSTFTEKTVLAIVQ